jgi:hypothetical protein
VTHDNALRLEGGRSDTLFRDAAGRWAIVAYKLTKNGPADAIKTYAGQLALSRSRQGA